MKYEWRDDQLWDIERACWVIWRTVSGQIGITDELREKIAHLLNTDTKSILHERDEAIKSRDLAEGARVKLQETTVTKKYHHDVINNIGSVVTDLKHQIAEAHAVLDQRNVPKNGPTSFKERPLELSLAGRVSIVVDALRESDFAVELLGEIDKTLQDAGVWVGGRLDSIKALIQKRSSEPHEDPRRTAYVVGLEKDNADMRRILVAVRKLTGAGP